MYISHGSSFVSSTRHFPLSIFPFPFLLNLIFHPVHDFVLYASLVVPSGLEPVLFQG